MKDIANCYKDKTRPRNQASQRGDGLRWLTEARGLTLFATARDTDTGLLQNLKFYRLSSPFSFLILRRLSKDSKLKTQICKPQIKKFLEKSLQIFERRLSWEAIW